jgi:YesN/AraC family two-component response regulator
LEKILVIDDEKATLTMFRLFLDAYGYSVYTAENGAEGLEIFRKENPAIVLTDIKMPGVDGLAVLQHIKEVAPQTAVIVITGHGDTALAEQAVALDAVDFINKPIKKEALDAALKKAREKLDSVRRNGGSQKG